MAVTAFQDFELADEDRPWDGDAAVKRVRAWAGADEEPNEKYRDAHVWYDADNKENFTAYKLPIHPPRSPSERRSRAPLRLLRTTLPPQSAVHQSSA